MHYKINTLDQLKPILIGYRKQRHLTQKDMATKIEVSQQAYQALESNPQQVSMERLFRVLTLLGVKLYLSDTPVAFGSQVQETRHRKEEW